MPDLNELLRWSIANSTSHSSDSSQVTPDESLTLRFNPANPDVRTEQRGQTGLSAFHPSDPGVSPVPPIPQLRSDLTPRYDLIWLTIALDDLEMLVESIDNANNLAVLKLWEPLLSLLKVQNEEILAATCWIIGTAVQNNIKAQAALHLHTPLTPILSLLSPSHSPQTRARATYALSSSLKHWPLTPTALSLNSDEGYLAISSGVRDLDVGVRRKMAFLVHNLVLLHAEGWDTEVPEDVAAHILEGRQGQEDVMEGLYRAGVFKELLNVLKGGRESTSKGEGEGEGDKGEMEYDEFALRALVGAIEMDVLTSEEKMQVKEIWEKWGNEGRKERGIESADEESIGRLLSL
ncbi:hypothetical protein TREMEDRAFT_73099 [Tremella mesenterica DSM 1558]|uniref:uncharacterized protein n=1 Tax=Tremella mesenterica (strain ATCC 24925 / CBS 8224 / DSM 1558 / NBRC 9311 / NRRL Y-6157 / RJB 2259-6 / UBC 559-6) TaxID=578456 RepID=UPI0003F4A5CA|nr:uncharacterized protein TREMEDRAFT_73099 [Tremella mesenterica DSM 1558]EIW73560.1 hypothetical protein TREMEDRAFT_73099 [Tremella mesenterica DSM 1558]